MDLTWDLRNEGRMNGHLSPSVIFSLCILPLNVYYNVLFLFSSLSSWNVPVIHGSLRSVEWIRFLEGGMSSCLVNHFPNGSPLFISLHVLLLLLLPNHSTTLFSSSFLHWQVSFIQMCVSGFASSGRSTHRFLEGLIVLPAQNQHCVRVGGKRRLSSVFYL